MQKSEIGKSPAFRFYAADFSMDTQSWTAEEVGVYVRLLCSEWINGSIPPMPEAHGTGNGKPMAQPMASPKQAINRLARIAGTSEEQLFRVWPQVGEKFSRGKDGNLYNSRLEHERDKQIAYRNEKSKAGTAGAEKRWTPTRTKVQADSRAIVLPLANEWQADGTAIVLPLANGMANDGGSFSFSSSFSKKEKEQGACSAAENPPPITHEEEERIAKRIWEQIEETPEGKALAEGLLGPRSARR
jgi:uncharacterized protein YdaU (DUF1376 family)